jgi:N-formylglutamate amidohydrolase
MESPAPFRAFNLANPPSPVVISVPHAGRAYPAACAPLCRVPPEKLRRLEDRYADQLVSACVDAGYSTIIAHTPRLWIDLNRAEDDVADRLGVSSRATPPSAKARSGLGLVPTRLAGVGDIWRVPPSLAQIQARIAQVHRPYHAAVRKALAVAHAKFGAAVLLDIHSMPPLIGADRPEIVIGDRFGRAARMEVSDCARAVCGASGFRVALNTPYAGAYVLEQHGRPAEGVHALQLEVCRSTYLDAALDQPSDRLPVLQELILSVAAALAMTVATGQALVAAE